LSIKYHKSDDADLLTDSRARKAPCSRLRIRLILGGAGNVPPTPLQFLGLSFADKKYEAPVLPPNRTAWGKSIAVPERSQLDFPEGEQSWCSPASTSMMLAYWANKSNRPDLNQAVPEVAK